MLADFQCLLAVFGLDDLEIQPFQDPPCDFSDDARVIDNQTCLHFQPLLLSSPERVVSITDRVACALCLPYAATLSGAISRIRSTSSTTISCPSSRCTPWAILVSRRSRLTGLASRLTSASLRTSPIESISSPYDSPRRSTPTAIGGLPSSFLGRPSRARMSTTVTMRPRRLSTPAISWEASGTRVSRSGMNTSCTREIGSPNNCPPITAVTYSATPPSMLSVLVVITVFPLGRALDVGGLFLQRRDQAGTVELGDVVVEAGLPPALDRGRRDHRGQRDDRHRTQMRIGLDGLGELEPVHVGHLDVGQNHVEDLARAQRGEAFLGIGGDANLVAGGFEHRGQHVAEEG